MKNSGSILVFVLAICVLFEDLARGETFNVSGSCSAGAEFTVFGELLSFKEAVEFCKNQSSTLARISNPNEHLRVVDLILKGTFGRNIWIGKSCG